MGFEEPIQLNSLSSPNILEHSGKMSGAAIENRVFFMTLLTLKAKFEVAERYRVAINIATNRASFTTK